ncbi:MAG: hypothetical protein COW70_13090 [Hydrogenophilales bacterium CG18_big_fil_WC_8_21_14_2_50_58_12]|nr:MAG: hypothetical protein COW70_13090 [Hydrogenophilales bacterium CG18_big_fil_WC_8_21_14_2_50_58_12]
MVVNNNFNYFAMMYLNDWYSSDMLFMEGISSSETSKRLTKFHDAAKYYKVTRNFITLDGEVRLEGALEILLQESGPITDENVCSKVTLLAETLKKRYGKNVVSAASKFLWLRFRSPVIIFDSRALNWLKVNQYPVSPIGSYESYREQWLAAFKAHEKQIETACNGIPAVRKYTLACDESENVVSEICVSRWFRERVFDKYLWFNGGGG